jgi:o-succinylbenzoate synthase
VKLEAVELRRIKLALVAPFETSFGVQTERDILLLRAITDAGEGWGECVAGEEPRALSTS